MSSGTSSTPSRRSRPSSKMCSGTTRIAHFSSRSAGRRDDASVTTTTAMALPAWFLVAYPGFGQRLEHQLRDRLVSLEIPVDAVGIATPTHNVFGHSGFEIHQRNIVFLRPVRDRGRGPRTAMVSLAVRLSDVHRRQRRH